MQSRRGKGERVAEAKPKSGTCALVRTLVLHHRSRSILSFASRILILLRTLVFAIGRRRGAYCVPLYKKRRKKMDRRVRYIAIITIHVSLFICHYLSSLVLVLSSIRYISRRPPPLYPPLCQEKVSHNEAKSRK